MIRACIVCGATDWFACEVGTPAVYHELRPLTRRRKRLRPARILLKAGKPDRAWCHSHWPHRAEARP